MAAAVAVDDVLVRARAHRNSKTKSMSTGCSCFRAPGGLFSEHDWRRVQKCPSGVTRCIELRGRSTATEPRLTAEVEHARGPGVNHHSRTTSVNISSISVVNSD